MPELNFTKTHVINVLQHISNGLGATFNKGVSQAEMVMDNENGKGKIIAIELSGISCLVYDITFFKDISYSIIEEEDRHLYFIYVIEGYFHHKLGKSDILTKLDAHQNIISEVDTKLNNYVKYTKNVPLKFVVINVNHKPQDERLGAYLNDLNKDLSAAFSRTEEDKLYHYTGNYSFKAMKSVEYIFDIPYGTAIGRMRMESTICSILAAQIEEYEHNFYSEPQVQLSPGDMKKIQQITLYIQENLTKKHTVIELSKQSGLSQKKLQCAFKAVYQTTAIRFINDMKLEKSREWLMENVMNISEISYKLGFSNSSYFNYLFKRKFGISPLVYRKKATLQDSLNETYIKPRKVT